MARDMHQSARAPFGRGRFLLIHLYTALWSLDPAVSRLHSLQNLSRHFDKRLIDIGSKTSRRLQKWQIVLFCESLPFRLCYNPLRTEITLVSHQELADIVLSVLLNFLHPPLHVVESLNVGDVVNNDDAVCAPIVCAADCAKALLPGGVPNLQLDRLAVQIDGSDLKVNANCADVALSVGVVRKS